MNTVLTIILGEREIDFKSYTEGRKVAQEFEPGNDLVWYPDRSEEDVVIVMKIHNKGTSLFFPLQYFGTEKTGVERLLTEYLSVCFLLEHIPPFDTLDQAREALRRIQCWLEMQDKGLEGYATPHYQHLHHSMPRIIELYIMATKCPWGYQSPDRK